MSALLASGSISLVLVWLLAGGLGIPLPEDAAILAAGVLVARGVVVAPVAFVLVMAAVLGGDLLLFLFARRLGPAAYERRVFRRLLPPKRRARVEALYARHGGKVVFVARHIVGVRAAAFALAGMNGMAVKKFIAWDAFAAALSVPVVMGLGYFGAQHLDAVRRGLSMVEHDIALVVVIAVAAVVVLARAVQRR